MLDLRNHEYLPYLAQDHIAIIDFKESEVFDFSLLAALSGQRHYVHNEPRFCKLKNVFSLFRE